MVFQLNLQQSSMPIFIFLGLWVALTVAVNEMIEQPIRHPDCPLIDDPLHPVQLPYPIDCRKYYTCKNGYAYALLCENGLQWNLLTYRCDFPYSTKCANNIPGSIYPTNPTNEGSTYPTLEKTFFTIDSADCNKFYKCIPMRCPSFMYWNSLLERCDLPQNGDCRNSPQIWTLPPYIDNSIPTAATPPAASQGDRGPASYSPEYDTDTTNLFALCKTPGIDYVRHPLDCHKFIQCDGFANVQTCGNGLFWNSEIMACDRYCK